MVKKRRRHTAAYKFRVALEALEGSKTISQLSSEHEIHANLIRAWKRQLLEGGPSVFASNGERKQREQEAQEAELYEQIGRLKMELEWLKKKLPASIRERRPMIDIEEPVVRVRRQCELLGLKRSSFYYQATPEPALNLHLMRLMGIQAIYPRRSSSSPGKGHKRYPYLLRNVPITHVNQVWSADITYVPLLRGFIYLVAVIDWHSRYVLAWQLSNTLTASSVSMPCARRSARGGPRSSTPTRAHSSRPMLSRPPCSQPTFRSAWTGAAARSTTSSANGSGAASSMRTSISSSTTRCANCKLD